MRSRRAVGLLGCWAAGLSLTACDFNKVNVPKTTPRVAVHAVLYGSADDQVVLVERTLTGAVAINDSQTFNPAEPILSDGGVPIFNAIVEITTPTGQVVRGSMKGAGVYRVPLPGASTVTLKLTGTD